jgi:hypothetical protein
VSAESVILQGRTFNEALMASTGVVRRKTGATTTDPVTYVESPVWAVIFTGPGKLRFPEARPGDANIPGAVLSDQRPILSLPVSGTETVTTGDVWECTANPLDTALVGKKVRIDGVHAQTAATARRFPVVEVS